MRTAADGAGSLTSGLTGALTGALGEFRAGLLIRTPPVVTASGEVPFGGDGSGNGAVAGAVPVVLTGALGVMLGVAPAGVAATAPRVPSATRR